MQKVFLVSIFFLLFGVVMIVYYSLGKSVDPLGTIVGAIFLLFGFVGFILTYRRILFGIKYEFIL